MKKSKEMPDLGIKVKSITGRKLYRRLGGAGKPAEPGTSAQKRSLYFASIPPFRLRQKQGRVEY
ncbi:MAG: hypothetical protein H6559_00220 [Lewinellaceae bacterium]|nr:hypothetical protein [Lewinellaceae bacterium]